MTSSLSTGGNKKRHNFGLKNLTIAQNRLVRNLRSSFINLSKGGIYGMNTARSNLGCLLEQFTVGKLTAEGARAGSYLGNSIYRIRKVRLEEERAEIEAGREKFVSICRKSSKK
jgi:hypothetical protein